MHCKQTEIHSIMRGRCYLNIQILMGSQMCMTYPKVDLFFFGSNSHKEIKSADYLILFDNEGQL